MLPSKADISGWGWGWVGVGVGGLISYAVVVSTHVPTKMSPFFRLRYPFEGFS